VLHSYLSLCLLLFSYVSLVSDVSLVSNILLVSLSYSLYSLLAGPPGAALDYFTISLWKSPVQIDLRTLRALGGGEPTTNKICIHKPTPRSNFCLLAPTQLFTLQGISDGVSMEGTPGGQHLGSPPGSVPSQGEMRSPCQISGWWLVWVQRQAAGHTHTLSSLYRRFTFLVVIEMEKQNVFRFKSYKCDMRLF
jgi:hypothetical protein